MILGLLLLFIGFILTGMEDSATVGYILMGLGGLRLLFKLLDLLGFILKPIADFLNALVGNKKKETAYWIQKTHLSRADVYECSSCGGIYNKPYSYCPNCGLEMTKTEYDPTWVDSVKMLCNRWYRSMKA